MTSVASVHRDMFAAVEQRDFPRLRALYHPDYTYTGGDGVEQKGADAGVAVAETYTAAFPDLTFETRHQYGEGAVSILEVTARGTHQADLEGIPATGRSIEVVACNVIEVQDGLILREREYFDTFSIMRRLGVLDG